MPIGKLQVCKTPCHGQTSVLLLLGVILPSPLVSACPFCMYRFDFVGCRCMAKRVGQHMLPDLGVIADVCLAVDYVENVGEWNCFEVTPLCPRAICDQVGGGHMVLQCHEPAEKSMRFSLKRGLMNFFLVYMRKLYDAAAVKHQGRKPTGEGPLLHALAEFAFGGTLGPQMMRGIVEARSGLPDNLPEFVATSPLAMGEVSAVLGEEIKDHELEGDIAEFKERMQAQRLRQKPRLSTLSATVAEASSSSSSAASGRKKVVVFPSIGFSKAQAKWFLPSGATLSTEKAWHHRWKVQSKMLGSRSRASQGAAPSRTTTRCGTPSVSQGGLRAPLSSARRLGCRSTCTHSANPHIS